MEDRHGILGFDTSEEQVAAEASVVTEDQQKANDEMATEIARLREKASATVRPNKRS